LAAFSSRTDPVTVRPTGFVPSVVMGVCASSLAPVPPTCRKALDDKVSCAIVISAGSRTRMSPFVSVTLSAGPGVAVPSQVAGESQSPAAAPGLAVRLRGVAFAKQATRERGRSIVTASEAFERSA
jgi:hypothetical protein